MSTFTCPIVTIRSVEKHPNADKLDILRFEEVSWICIDVRDKRNVGDKVVYIPIDAMVDCTRPEFEFLRPRAKMRWVDIPTADVPEVELRVQKPIARIRTIKLRQQISQGLVIDLPLIKQPEIGEVYWKDDVDFASYFGIIKYEPPQEAVFSANAKGTFPGWCPKTDCERIQNYNRTVENYLDNYYTASIKVDGTSCTVFYDKDRVGDEKGVCSRNQELKPPDQQTDGSGETKWGFNIDVYWKNVLKYDILTKVEAIANTLNADKVALQFELAGASIQNNRLGLKDQKLFLFDIYVISKDFVGYINYPLMLGIAENFGIETVPIFKTDVKLSTLTDKHFDFSFVHDMKYPNGHLIEGLVFVENTGLDVGTLGRLKFKYINPHYLLELGEDE